MKAYFTAAVAALAVAAPAHASTFDGPFIGVDIGYDHAEVQTSSSFEETFGTMTFTGADHEDGRSANGLAGGIFAGYDANFGGKFFGGVEARVGLSDAKASEKSSFSFTDTANPGSNDSGSEKASAELRESFSATVRLGYLLNESTGIYLRGGIVETRFKLKDTDGILVGFDADDEGIYKNSVKDTNTGFLYGAGLETAVTGNTSLRVEYNVTQYGGVFKKLNNLDLGVGETSKTEVTNHQVRLAVAYTF